MDTLIYLAVFADGSSYVGQTGQGLDMIEHRYRGYTKKQRNLRPSEQACFALGMPALGVIEYCPPEKLDERERYWIEMHRQEGPNLNVADGGGAQKGAETRLARLRRMESKLAKQARRQRR